MKVLFLDCDGVINHSSWYKSAKYFNNEFIDPDIDPRTVSRLNAITSNTGAKIVISSSWKVDPYARVRLETAGIQNIIDCTPNLIFTAGDDYSRGMEIAAWLKDHPSVENYVIVDDMYDFFEEQRDHVYLIDYQLGLTKDDAYVIEVMLQSNVLNNK